MLMALPLPGLQPPPRPGSPVRAALVEAELGDCADCDQPATKLLVGADQPDVSVCERCEYGRYLQATSGRDYANEERSRWGLPPLPRPDLRDAPPSAAADEAAKP